MQNVGAILKKTRLEAIAMEEDEASDLFREQYGLKEGDYIHVNRGSGWMPCRILHVESCFYNSRGTYTARVKLASLTQSGRVSTSRGLWMTCKGPKSEIKAFSPCIRVCRAN